MLVAEPESNMFVRDDVLWPNASKRSRAMRKNWTLRTEFVCIKCGGHARARKGLITLWGCASCDTVTVKRTNKFRKVDT
jgi:hypothetical protein